VSFLDGAKAALRGPVRSLTAAQADLLGPAGPYGPPPAVVSPWADDSNLSSVVFSDLFGADYSPMNRSEAMAIPAVARARTLITSTLGRIPFTATDANGADAIAGTCLANLDPRQAPFILKAWTVDDLIFSGVSYWLILTRYAQPLGGGLGKPATVRRIQPGGVEVDKLGNVVKVYGTPVNVDDVIRIDGPHEGILNYAAGSLRASRSLELSAARFSSNPVPAIELHQTDDYPLTPDERNQLVSDWAKARAGENGGVAYTSRSIEAKVHGAPAENLLLGGRNVAAIDSARIVGVPADAIDATPDKASMTYANVETRLKVLIDYGLAAYAAAIVSRLSMDDVLPRGTVAGFRGLVLDELDTNPDPASGGSAVPAPTPPAPRGDVTPPPGKKK
jgi:hypothetical protein